MGWLDILIMVIVVIFILWASLYAIPAYVEPSTDREYIKLVAIAAVVLIVLFGVHFLPDGIYRGWG